MMQKRWLARLGAAFKAAPMAWSAGRAATYLAPWSTGMLPGARFDYEREAGDPTDNGAVSICLGWIGDNFPEPRLVVERKGGRGEREVAGAHPLVRLVESPNPFYDGDALLAATAMSYSAF